MTRCHKPLNSVHNISQNKNGVPKKQYSICCMSLSSLTSFLFDYLSISLSLFLIFFVFKFFLSSNCRNDSKCFPYVKYQIFRSIRLNRVDEFNPPLRRENGMQWKKKLEYSLLPFFRSFNVENKKIISLFKNLSKK